MRKTKTAPVKAVTKKVAPKAVTVKAKPVKAIGEDWEVTECEGDYLCNNTVTNQFFRTSVQSDIPTVIAELSA